MWITRACTTVVLLGLVGGCTTGRGPSAADSAETTKNSPASGAPPAAGEMVFPIDTYSVTTAERVGLSRARTILVGQCLRRFGFQFDSSASTTGADQAIGNEVKDFGTYGNKRRYGVTTVAAATRYGYHLESVVDGTAVPVTKGGKDPHGFGDLTPAMESVLRGLAPDGSRPQAVGGQQVPAGGCLGEANEKLAAAGGPPSFNLAELVGRIRADSFSGSLTDPTVTAGIAAWATCMRGKGYDYPMPLEVPRDFGIEDRTVPPREVATAQADVACKQQTKLVDIWSGFEVSYQRQQIDKNAEELQRIKDEHAARMRVVAQVIANA